MAVIDRYLAGNEACLAAPVLVKTIPECKVAYMQVRLDSYDCLFEKMPEMGDLMERAGCLCALPEYCFTGYLEAEYKEENNLEICGPIRESYIDGVWNKDDESQWLSEIQVPVR